MRTLSPARGWSSNLRQRRDNERILSMIAVRNAPYLKVPRAAWAQRMFRLRLGTSAVRDAKVPPVGTFVESSASHFGRRTSARQPIMASCIGVRKPGSVRTHPSYWGKRSRCAGGTSLSSATTFCRRAGWITKQPSSPAFSLESQQFAPCRLWRTLAS